MPDVSKSDPAEGSREVIDRELERQGSKPDVPAQVHKRRKVRAVAARTEVPAKILRSKGPARPKKDGER